MISKNHNIGIFWYIPLFERLLSVDFNLYEEMQKPINERTNFITAPTAHFLEWSLIINSFNEDEYHDCEWVIDKEYNYFPRGRINYLLDIDTFEIDMDGCLHNKEILDFIIESYHLTGEKTRIVAITETNKNTQNKKEGHYSCYQCRQMKGHQ